VKQRIILQDKEVIGKAILDGEMVVFEGLPEEVEDMLYQGFYLEEHDKDPNNETFLAPDENASMFFKLLPISDMPGLNFGKITNYEE
jgi:hypothetical protein